MPITPAVRDLIRLLAQREELGTAYLVPAARGRVALVLPNDRGGHTRAAAYSWATIRTATQAELVEVPDGSHPVTFLRERGDSRNGEIIRLTGVGRAASKQGGRT
ncbi:hypothetical protein [Agromyces bauzanensis]